ADADAVRRLAQRLALAAGRRLDDASPYVDAALPGGVRLHAVLPPIATGCTCISLRVLRPTTHGLDALQAVGSVSPEAGKLLRAIVAARLAFLIVGGTGSGNTILHLRHTYWVIRVPTGRATGEVVGRLGWGWGARHVFWTPRARGRLCFGALRLLASPSRAVPNASARWRAGRGQDGTVRGSWSAVAAGEHDPLRSGQARWVTSTSWFSQECGASN
ncbi:MAG: pilus assembly protein CpaF, partial [Solirubrobacteraceae bacterium]|nr:pilus assembly protein CpaF [Solirubrobacteraceae bacterium]